MDKCPYCAEEIQNEATICKHCGRDLTEEPPDVTSRKRAELVQIQAALEKNLTSWELHLQDQDELAKQARRQMTWAIVGLIVGIVLIPLYGVGFIPAIIGILATIIQSEKLRKAENKKIDARRNIVQRRKELIEVKKALATL